MQTHITIFVLLTSLMLGVVKVRGEEFISTESEILFVRRVAPLLREKCLGCHGGDPNEIEGSLDLG